MFALPFLAREGGRFLPSGKDGITAAVAARESTGRPAGQGRCFPPPA
jgi:hypothetical protein